MARKRTDIDMDDVIRRYLAGQSVRELAALYQCSEALLHKRLKEAGVSRSPREARILSAAKQPEPPYVDEIVRRYLAGERQYDIAAALGLNQASVSRWIIKRGVNISRSEALQRRYARMTPEERRALAAKAHDAVRGVKRTPEDLAKRALSKQRSRAHVSEAEIILAGWLKERGISVIHQQAVGPYNADLGAFPVAVEVFGGQWHAHGRHAARLPKRTHYFFDQGWNVYIIWVNALHHPLTPDVTEDLVAFIERSRRDPSFRRQYRVVWGNGQFIASGSADDDHLTLIPSGARGDYRRTRN